jgi:hypothetical protein
VKEAKAVSVMGAYNRLNGEPCCASPTLLDKILRQEWGFEGYVVSDCRAIGNIYAHHKLVETATEAAALAVKVGCDLNCGRTFAALLEAVEKGLAAAYFGNREFSGEPALSRVDPLIDFVWKDVTPVTGRMGDSFSVRWTGSLIPPITGRYKLGVRGMNRYCLTLDDQLIAEHHDLHEAITRVKEIELEAGRLYYLRLEYVNHGLDPRVRLLWSVPGADLVAPAVEAAKSAEVVVMIMGLSPIIEDEEIPVAVEGFAGGDRTDIVLPQPQEELLQRIHDLGKPIVLVLLNGSALAVNWADDNIPAIVEAWYPGQAGGDAIADVLFGDYNPGGRLPVTFYRSVDDLPPIEDYRMEGRTYRYFTASVPVPIRQLQGFERIHLAPGETKTVTFTLAPRQLSLVEDEGRRVIEPGSFQVAVGGHQPSSEDLIDEGTGVLITTLEVTGGVTVIPG